MNCKRAKAQLALLIGNDLDPAAVGDVRKHLDQCGDCRDHLKRLAACLDVLQIPDSSAWNSDGESLWQELSIRLPSETTAMKPHRLNGWAASLAVAAACAAMVWVTSRQWPDRPAREGGSIQIQPINDDSPIPIDGQNPDEFRAKDRRLDDKSGKLQRRSITTSPIPVVPINL